MRSIMNRGSVRPSEANSTGGKKLQRRFGGARAVRRRLVSCPPRRVLMVGLDLSELHADIRTLGLPHLTASDDRFLVWFLHAYFQLDLKAAEEALLGRSGDKGVDALVIDEQEKTVHVIQAKYHAKSTVEERDPVISFATLGQVV